MNMHVTVPSDPAPTATPQLPIPKATVEDIVAKRNVALERYAAAHSTLETAAAALQSASEARQFTKGGESRYNHHLNDDRDSMILSIQPGDRAQYLARARRIVDTDAWSHVIEITQLERLMDRQAKDEFTASLQKEPPEVTVDNIYATLESLLGQAGFIMRRGIANCFSALDRRFKSHDGFKLGHRIILERAFDDWGSWNHHRNQRDALMDVERALLQLDGQAVPLNYAGAVGRLEQARRDGGSGARQTQVDTEMFGFRCFKNGDLHIWFRRDDLLQKVNRLLGEYYGEVVPDGQTPADDGGLFDPKLTPAKNHGFFPTPDELADRVIGDACLTRDKESPKLTVLEPNAGTGQLSRRCVDQRPLRKAHGYGAERYHWTTITDVCEVQPDLAARLAQSGIYRKVWAQDFLLMKPDPTNLYDRVVMNPPFDRERDIDHVVHALQFLKPDGLLVAVMSAGTEFRETRKPIAFREHIAKMNGYFSDLPAGSFTSVGTNVNTVLLKVSPTGGRWFR